MTDDDYWQKAPSGETAASAEDTEGNQQQYDNYDHVVLRLM